MRKCRESVKMKLLQYNASWICPINHLMRAFKQHFRCIIIIIIINNIMNITIIIVAIITIFSGSEGRGKKHLMKAAFTFSLLQF